MILFSNVLTKLYTCRKLKLKFGTRSDEIVGKISDGTIKIWGQKGSSVSIATFVCKKLR